MKYYEGYEGPDDVEGYVYVFKCGVHYKIGFSKHPLKRRTQLSTGAPLPVEYVHMFWTPFCRQIEGRLHGRFREKRGCGEWFTLTDADVAYIKSIDQWGMSADDRARKAEREAEYAERQKQDKLPPPGSPEALEKALQHIEKVFGERLDSHRSVNLNEA